MTIKRIGPVSCAKIAAVTYAAFGLIMGALISVGAMVGSAFSRSASGASEAPFGPLLGAVMGVGAIIICPILYGAIGALFALIGAWLYNLVASKVGGIEIEVSEISRSPVGSPVASQF